MSKAKYDDLDTKQIFIIGIASVAVTLVTVLAVQYVYFLLVYGHEETLQAQSSYGRQNRILAEQVEEISQYGVDPDTANVTIPIEDAMALVVREHASGSTGHGGEEPETADETENDAT